MRPGGRIGAETRSPGRSAVTGAAGGIGYGLLVLATAVCSGLVGDSLTVLDRAEARIRAGLHGWTALISALAGVLGAVTALLIAVALVICAWVAVWLVRARPGRLAQVAAGLLIGGAVGNVIDRMVYGAVADFLNMSLPGWRNPYSFNLADIAIFAGALGLVFQPGPRPEPEPADKNRDGKRKTR